MPIQPEDIVKPRFADWTLFISKCSQVKNKGAEQGDKSHDYCSIKPSRYDIEIHGEHPLSQQLILILNFNIIVHLIDVGCQGVVLTL